MMNVQLTNVPHAQPGQAFLGAIRQIEGLASGARAEPPATLTSADELAWAASELSQLASYLGQVYVAHRTMLGKIAHELRTPLTIMKGWVQMLSYGELLPGQERIIQVVDRQVDDLTRLVNDLLDCSQEPASALRLELVDLAQLVAQIAEHQRGLAATQGIELLVQAPSVYAYIDRSRIAQVLNNLIDNACRSIPRERGGQVTLRVAGDASAAQISVCDNGVGMPAEALLGIFEPFYQVPGQQSGRRGLGLTICNELVRAHGGTLTVESAPGSGTSFHIWLRRIELPSSEVLQ